MNLRSLENVAKTLCCFSLQQLRVIDPSFLRLNLNVWHEKGYIDRVSKGRYTLSSFEKVEENLFFISNQIYSPSYVSMESALRYYNLIPEGVFMVTSCTTKKTQKLEGDRGTFYYYHIKPKLMWGYNIIKYNNISFYMASVEKLLCDFFYLKPNMDDNDIKELRIDFELLKTLTTKELLLDCAKKFKNKRVYDTMNKFISYIG